MYKKVYSFERWCLREDTTLFTALSTLESNTTKVCFVVSSSGKFIGSITDGDIRRGLLVGSELGDPVTKVLNQAAVYVRNEQELDAVQLSGQSIDAVPLLDGDHCITAILVPNSYLDMIPLVIPDLSGNEIKYVNDCVEGGWISSKGVYVSKFESMFSDRHNGHSAVSVSNGTVALELAMKAFGIGHGDEVIVPNLTFAATVNAVINCGAVPVLCEVDETTWCLSIEEVLKLVNGKTKAIIPVHLYGKIFDTQRFREVLNRSDIYIIEDCAEGLGSRKRDMPLGVHGDASTFSFFANKVLTTGEGGMVLFRDSAVAKTARQIRDHGMNQRQRYYHEIIGSNYRMTNLQAAVGVAQMERLDKFLIKRASIFREYQTLFNGLDYFVENQKNTDETQVCWLYTVLLKEGIDRDRVIETLAVKYNIESRPTFRCLHSMPPYKNFAASESLRTSEKISTYGISLPTFTSMSSPDIRRIATRLIAAIEASIDIGSVDRKLIDA